MISFSCPRLRAQNDGSVPVGSTRTTQPDVCSLVGGTKNNTKTMNKYTFSSNALLKFSTETICHAAFDLGGMSSSGRTLVVGPLSKLSVYVWRKGSRHPRAVVMRELVEEMHIRSFGFPVNKNHAMPSLTSDGF
jgi:hypothetical protein